MDRMHTHNVVALTTIASIFRTAVTEAYEQDDFFHQKLQQTTPAQLMQDLLVLEAQLDETYKAPDYSRDYYFAVLAFNEKFMQAYTAVTGDDAIKSHLPEGQGSNAQAQDFTSLGCPTLARLFKPTRAAAPR